MPCDYEQAYEDSVDDPVALAEMGLSQEQIVALQMTAQAARETAKAAAYGMGLTRDAQEELIKNAVSEAVREWHIEDHAQLQAWGKELLDGIKAKRLPALAHLGDDPRTG